MKKSIGSQAQRERLKKRWILLRGTDLQCQRNGESGNEETKKAEKHNIIRQNDRELQKEITEMLNNRVNTFRDTFRQREKQTKQMREMKTKLHMITETILKS